MISSDSDSYGSEGGLKEKPVIITKRGGKKRNKPNNALAMDWNEVEDTVYSSDTNQEGEIDPAIIIEDETPKKEEETSNNQEEETPKEEDEEEETPLFEEDINPKKIIPRAESEAIPKQKMTGPPVIVSSKHKGGGGNFVPKRRREYSPPMIKEYDPNEDNAKTRAKKRADEIKKREKCLEIDRSQYPDNPTPWKGKPSEFFIVHTSRRGDQKVLNNS
jgi:hypothetical protein